MGKATIEWVGTADLAFRLGLTPWQAYRLVLSGKLEARREGGKWQVSRASVDRYERESRPATGPYAQPRSSA